MVIHLDPAAGGKLPSGCAGFEPLWNPAGYLHNAEGYIDVTVA